MVIVTVFDYSHIMHVPILPRCSAFSSSAFSSTTATTTTRIASRPGIRHYRYHPRRRVIALPPLPSSATTARRRTVEPQQRHPTSTVLWNSYRPQDSFFSGVAEIGIAFALGVVYSEYWIIRTGCGPPNFNDTLERICYQGVLIYAGLALFHRIVSSTGGTSSNGWRSRSVRETMEQEFGPLLSTTLWQMEIAEYSSALAVLGAVVALVLQYNNQQTMDGLSGIDINMCRAIRGDM